jgi:hypothetical protein
MKNTLQKLYQNRHSDNACSKAKRRVNLKVPIKTTKK